MTNLHTAWARLIIRSFADSGVRHVVISPGSRSTPLALAAAEEQEVQCHAVVDERTAGFFALGQGRWERNPTLLICTSGTAGAHYLPAIIEASQSYIPLVVMTADRPWEAYDAALSQTTDQVKLFGNHVRHYAEIGLPDPQEMAMLGAQRIAAQAVYRSQYPVPGVVHINARFRKPLEPIVMPAEEPWEETYRRIVGNGPSRFFIPQMSVHEEAIDQLTYACLRSHCGWIACGPSLHVEPQEKLCREVVKLAKALGFGVLAEIASGVRCGLDPAQVVAPSFFASLLRSCSWHRSLCPDLILEINAPLVSEEYHSWVRNHRWIDRYVVAPYGWNDSQGGARMLIHGPPSQVLSGIRRRLDPGDKRSVVSSLKQLQKADRYVESILEQEWQGGSLTEGMVAFSVMQALQQGDIMMIGNSNPIRLFDRYCPVKKKPIYVFHQRGVSGIDGLVAGAVGIQKVAKKRMVLVVGDLSFLHDLGGLVLCRQVEGPLVIVVIHNGGGRIFEQLPVARQPSLAPLLERYFVVFHHLTFKGIADMCGVYYVQVTERTQLADALTSGLNQKGCTVIEVKVPPHDSQRRWSALGAQVDEYLKRVSQ
ncbi:2-succinyl-5-enolpyruvyl-6-hydroxy-3-cyclohexene-1-carboxylic-acid synthase [Pajaroellobacter abortibovis]|uniref:2-succinyl-5-enolpyruvyl-6-hydroxy-3-cyclohexene-1-carboxylate synthase n=1 Tax=Pajaroellobacter abortibovis TaxID=1882918 RepID=A0A1L6MWK2_9BACT|nr:2-succinyl-5-enolpyruvyl-6-hydroxy-3-cyclohexene-1-carboxylic-acid synthase [Pajaroellobacter abortibovis]APR99939.1 2-succinyl-5-enolpyruvyl-6-hydroxy-3-cyclohexene-1-carboxylic-acid synthase [Pajaroellobacter abortibovis]